MLSEFFECYIQDLNQQLKTVREQFEVLERLKAGLALLPCDELLKRQSLLDDLAKQKHDLQRQTSQIVGKLASLNQLRCRTDQDSSTTPAQP